MAEELTLREAERWKQMKILRAQGLEFWEWVKPLHARGLLECRNCKAGTPNNRVTSDGDEVCMTCEDTLTQFWRRNIRRLAVEEAVVLEVKGEWIAAHQHIAKTCLRNMVVTAEVTTEKTVIEKRTRVENGKEIVDLVPVTTTTTRREHKMNVSVARLLGDVQDKMAKMAGLDVTDPAGATPPPPRKKMHVHRDDGDTERPELAN